jgi:nucleotide-binding universal stress UspA family protein
VCSSDLAALAAHAKATATTAVAAAREKFGMLRTGLKRGFIGSVAERVVRHAPCSVLVVR